MSRSRAISGLIGLGVALCVGSTAFPAPASAADTVLQVVAVRVNPGQLNAYLARVQQLQGILKRLRVQVPVRVWQATLAGDATGTVVVGLEFANLAAFADASGKMEKDAEWQQVIAGLAEIRTVLSTSLYGEITP